MAELTLNGDLDLFLGEFIDTFNGGVGRGAGSSFSASSGFPYGATMSGSGLFFETSGSNFVRGTVTSVKLMEGIMRNLSSPIKFTTRVEITDISFGASSVFELVSRSGTSSFGRFLDSEFLSILNRYSFEVSGSDEDDIAGNGTRLRFGGNDKFNMGAGADRVFAGAGRDKIAGGSGDDILSGETGNDKLLGGRGSDTLHGGDGRDRLVGSQGKDALDGGSGDDRLDGGNGRDILTGGSGSDVFVFADGYGKDRVEDFDPTVDSIQLDSDLWQGNLDASEVLNTYGRVGKNGVVLDFGEGDVLLLRELTTLDGLEEHLVIL